MKVITINIHNTVRYISIAVKAFTLLLLFALTVNFFTGRIYEKKLYINAINELTDEKIIIIDPGHGGEDCGAIGKNGKYEKELNLEVAKTLGDMLCEKGYAVVYTRTEDRLLYNEDENIKGLRKIYDLKNRCKLADKYENSIFISIHMNSYSDEKYSGLQVYYSKNNELSRELANSIQNTVREKLQHENKRAIKTGENMYLMKNLNNPAVLIECGFLSNGEDCRKLSEKEYQKQLSFTILCGIIEYIEKN